MFAKKNPETGEMTFPALELVRLAIPRRVYTQSHLDYVADVVAHVYRERGKLRGLNMVYEPAFLRHFAARFEWM
jgi:tryptophanase